MRTASWISLPCLAAGIVRAAALPQPTGLQARASPVNPLGSLITDIPVLGENVADSVASILGGIGSDLQELSMAIDAFASIVTAAKPTTTTPSNTEEAHSRVSSIFAPYATSGTPNIVVDAVELITNGFTVNDLPSLGDHGDGLSGPDSHNNTNSKNPKTPIFPKAGKKDVAYSQSEKNLRGAIYIPDSFTYGKSSRVPLILVPGTGAPSANANFRNNIFKLFGQGGPGADIADPVLLNTPDAVLDDISLNAEFVAYAIGYVAGITGKHVAVATWSQGSLDAGWALQYWPSTRAKVVDLINYSSDYHGTVNAYILNPGFPQLPSTPAVIQQEYNSTFVAVFRNGGGSSAYVPTTTIYSAFFDEIVQPQTLEGASGFIQDARKVGVSNNEIQSVCSGKPAGGFYTHEGVLYNPLAYALTVDALTNTGPGLASRIDLNTVCQEIVSPGLNLDDVLGTEAIIPIAALNIFAYSPKMFYEPAIKSYAS